MYKRQAYIVHRQVCNWLRLGRTIDSFNLGVGRHHTQRVKQLWKDWATPREDLLDTLQPFTRCHAVIGHAFQKCRRRLDAIDAESPELCRHRRRLDLARAPNVLSLIHI